MESIDGSLREQITGGRQAPAERKRLPKFDEQRIARQRLLRRAGLTGAGVALGGLLAIIGASLFAGEEQVPARDVPVGVAHNARVTSIDSDVLVSDGGTIRRTVPSVGLGGRALPGANETVRRPASEPERLQVPRVEGAEPAAIPRGPGHGARPDGTPATLMIAQSNLVWSRLFTVAGLDYVPVRHASRAAWAEGGCAARPMPEGPTYCPFDQTVYVEPGPVEGPMAVLALANEIGHHVQDILGVAIQPLSGEARDLQADCFAGLWARREGAATSGLAPAVLQEALAGGDPLAPWNRLRVEAFEQGYAARVPQDCGRVAAAAAASEG